MASRWKPLCLGQGYHGDTSAMFTVGEVSEEARALCQVTQLAMEEGIQQCRPGARFASICQVRHALAGGIACAVQIIALLALKVAAQKCMKVGSTD